MGLNLSHCKKRVTIFEYQAGMPHTKLSLAGNNKITPGQGEFGARDWKSLTFFYSVLLLLCSILFFSVFPLRLFSADIKIN